MLDNKEFIVGLYKELEWLKLVIQQSISSYLKHEGHERSWLEIEPPNLEGQNSPFANLVSRLEVDIYGRLALALTLAPHLQPQDLDIFFGRNAIYDRGFTEFGGVVDKAHSGFLPTGQTLLFLIGSLDKSAWLEGNSVFSKESRLIKEGVIRLDRVEHQIPLMNGVISMSKSWFHYFISGNKQAEEQSELFPATRIQTNFNWDDIILDWRVMEKVDELWTWLCYEKKLMVEWGLENKIKPGFRALFYGPPGTGKTLTATLLGKRSNRDVYRVDLSMVVSKYIGETEKNLAGVFDQAANKNWILFFDEADALFGKRTEANSSNDRYANQQTSYLLQKIEDFPGVVILASNLKANMDSAFTRRFQSIIHFTMPSVEARYKLWINAFSNLPALEQSVDLWEIAEEFELAGGSIINVLRYCALKTVQNSSEYIQKKDLLKGIQRELKKENKTMNILQF